MKKIILIINLFIAIIATSSAQDVCNILKLKITNLDYYINMKTNPIRIGPLDSATINLNSIPIISPSMWLNNIAKDTFSTTDWYMILSIITISTNTGDVFYFKDSISYNFHRNLYPNDIFGAGIEIEHDLLYMVDYMALKGFDFEQISCWKMINTVAYTNKDGIYSDSVRSVGSDTSIFYVVKTSVGIQEIENELTNPISVFPNPAQSQFTVTNTENASIQLYNLLGQKVKQITSTEENTVIQTDNLSAGIYVLKVEKGNAIFTKKVQVIR